MLARAPLPIRELLDLGAQKAGGLAAAHQAGIVHRDFKPENVMVTRDGRIKILEYLHRTDSHAGRVFTAGVSWPFELQRR